MIPNQVPFYDLSQVLADDKDAILGSIKSVVDSGMFVEGPAVREFESAFGSLCQSSYCVGVGNGLDAIRLSLQALGVGPGDEVIVPSFSFYATWLAVAQVGATIRIVDVDTRTAGMKLENVAEEISLRTKAIIYVHLFGIARDLTPLRSQVEKAGIYLLEDCAQAHGASANGKVVGSFGHAGCFSFYPTKNLGALGDGGAVTTSDKDLCSRLLSLRSYGRGETKYDHKELGSNSRLDEIQASVLNVRLSKLELENRRRNQIADEYLSALDGCWRLEPDSGVVPVWHHFILRSKARDELRDFFTGKGIGTDVHYPYSVSQIPPLQSYLANPMSDIKGRELAGSVVSLPIWPSLTDDQVTSVREAILGARQLGLVD